MKDNPNAINGFLISLSEVSEELYAWALKKLGEGYTIQSVKAELNRLIAASGR